MSTSAYGKPRAVAESTDPATRESEEPGATECAWNENMDGAWETACHGIFEITEGRPSENEMRFCSYCGGRIVETRFNWDADSEPIE